MVINMDLPQRKPNRLPQYNYNQNGAYFLTICTQNRKQILSRIIVGTGVLDCPNVQLLPHGTIAEKYIKQLDSFYPSIDVEKYIIMPDHIHLLIRIDFESGQPRTSVPTNKNSAIAQWVSTFKRFCNKEYGRDIWQSRYYDHVIRNQQDYDETWQYIENNPIKRQEKQQNQGE